MATDDVSAFLARGAELENVRWEARARESDAAPPRASNPADPAYCGWEDVDDGPADDDPSWAAFEPHEEAAGGGRGKVVAGGKKLTKAQREKLRDEKQLQEARESIRKRGWTENEVKWRSWLARRGRDVMVNDWNLKDYIDGECTPPSRDPFWLNANEVELPDYEAGNDGENEDPEPVVTNLMGDELKNAYQPPRQPVLQPLWWEVDGEALVRDTLGRKTEAYTWRQSTSMVYLEVKVPEGTSARELRVSMRPNHLRVAIGSEVVLDEELYMRIYVGSNADDNSSIWELQDRRCLVFHLVKWHRLEAGNVRDASRTWWRQCFVSEPPFEAEVPAGRYYEEKEHR